MYFGSMIVCCSLASLVAAEKWSWPQDAVTDADQIKQSGETSDGSPTIKPRHLIALLNSEASTQVTESSHPDRPGYLGPAGLERAYDQYARGSYNYANSKQILTGPNGPTGIIGPKFNHNFIAKYNIGNRPILTGPGGPTGIIGPGRSSRLNKGLLVGPTGATGLIGPSRNILVGPQGPTGIIGPGIFRQNNGYNLLGNSYGSLLQSNEFNHKGVLVGPRGLTNIIGPIGDRKYFS